MMGKDRALKKNMLSHAGDFRTICEVLREIYWAIEDPGIRLKVVEASMMAKKMSRSMVQNKFGVPEGMDYRELSEEDRESISKERWDKYMEELDRGIDHPMKETK